jgi:hypothetical protein
MKQSNVSYSKFLWRSVVFSIECALIGSMLFTVIVSLLVWVNDGRVDYWAVFFLLIGSSVLSCVPAILGGAWLASLVYHDAINGDLNPKRISKKGFLSGAILGLTLCFFVYVLTSFRMDLLSFIFFSLLVTAISSAIGSMLSKYLLVTFPKLLESG